MSKASVRAGLLVFVFASMLVFASCSSESKTLKISPKSLEFITTNIGDTEEGTLTLTNKYGKPVTISGMSITGTTDYTLDPLVTFPINMVKGGEYILKINFAPSTAGLIMGMLAIDVTETLDTFNVELEGTGVAVARIVLSDSSFDFDKKLIAKSHTHDVEIENIGTANLEITGLSFSGMSATSFKTNTPPIVIVPNAKDTITITFEPVAIGNYSAELSITHNAVNETIPITYALSGEGIDVDPRITLSVGTSWDLGTVATTIPSTQICEIENTGTDPLTVNDGTLSTGTQFTIEKLLDSNGNTMNFPQTIAVGAKIFLYVKFAPTALQIYNDTLSFLHDGTNEGSPFNIPMTGEGRNEITQSFNYTGNPVNWVVPARVHTIICEVWGAQGAGSIGGKGAQMKGTFMVTPGKSLEVFAGYQRGTYGGGDGSYVADGNTLMIMGGGGGGSYSTSRAGADAPITTSGTISPNHSGGAGGTNGQGGQEGTGAWGTGGGGGWLSAGGSGLGTAGGAIKGRSADGRQYAGGGGGGYSGGGGVEMYSGAGTGGGGAGGSYNDGANQSNVAAVNTGNGKVTITY